MFVHPAGTAIVARPPETSTVSAAATASSPTRHPAPATPRSCYAVCGGYELHYMDWGAPDAPLVIAWHGLARTGRDMDTLAAALSDRYRVICPDTLGRGLSQWSRDPDRDYCLRFYARQARELLDHLGAQQVHWLGTSMGGAIGTVAASGLYEPALRARIQSLVLNDNAPELAATAIERIRTYAGTPPAFDSVTALEAFFRQVYQPFGWMSPDEWRKLAETSTRRLPDGRVTPHYDPAMVRQFIAHPNDYRLWDHYDALDLPVLCLHGVESDLVLADTLAAMHTRGPGARGQLRVLDVPGAGHAPALNVPDQIQPIRQFLDAAQAQR